MTNRVRTRRRLVDLQATSSQQAIAATIPNDLNDALVLQIENRAPEDLTPLGRILRKRNKRQDAAYRAAIANFGNLQPLLIDPEGKIFCGELRWQAAMDLGLAQVPTITISHLSKAQLRLYHISETRIAELSEWDEKALKLEFKDLADLDLGSDEDLQLSGFTMSEIDTLMIDKAPALPAPGGRPTHPPATRAGDLWYLGEHRLYCGDALDEQSYAGLMGDERAQIAFVDAPFNLPMATISGQQREEFAQASGEMSREEFTAFLRNAFTHLARYSVDGAIHYQCMDYRHQREMLDAGEAVYSDLKNLVIWNKQTGGQGSFYRSQHELVFVWKVGTASHINNFGLGETGRYRTNVWDCPGNNSFHANRGEELATHPTVKPVALVADALRDCSHRGGIVLDAFGGSGSTLLAAEHTGRRARLIEIDPGYCDSTIERWQEMTGGEAVLLENGKSWALVAEERGVDLSAGEPSVGKAS